MRKLVIGLLIFIIVIQGVYIYFLSINSRTNHRVHYELANGKLIFDFPEPTVPKIYQVDYQYIPDPEFWAHFQRDFFKYCRQVKGLKELPDHRSEDDEYISYRYGKASLIYQKSTGNINFQNGGINSEPRFQIIDIPSMTSFIKNYGGGLNDNFVPVVTRGIPKAGGGITIFKLCIEGVKVTGDSWLDGVRIIQTKRGICEFARAIPRFTKGEAISPSQILSPLETLQLNSDDDYLSFLANSRERPV